MGSRTNLNVCSFLGSRAEKTAALQKSIIPEHPLMAKCTKESASMEKVKKIYISSLQYKEIVLTFPFLRPCLHFLMEIRNHLDSQKK